MQGKNVGHEVSMIYFLGDSPKTASNGSTGEGNHKIVSKAFKKTSKHSKMEDSALLLHVCLRSLYWKTFTFFLR